MRLSSKRKYKELAFEDKVVWITGASQVTTIAPSYQFASSPCIIHFNLLIDYGCSELPCLTEYVR